MKTSKQAFVTQKIHMKMFNEDIKIDDMTTQELSDKTSDRQNSMESPKADANQLTDQENPFIIVGREDTTSRTQQILDQSEIQRNKDEVLMAQTILATKNLALFKKYKRSLPGDAKVFAKEKRHVIRGFRQVDQ